jgi:hypothetical protein
VSSELGSCALESNEMETANYVMALNAMELNETVLILREKALANCSLVQDEKGSYGQETSFLKALNSMAECMLGLNAMGSNKLDLFAYSAMKVLSKSDSSSCNCSHG